MIFLCCLCSIVLFSSNNDIAWPLPERKGLLSSFGEWREGHLHAGIDLPTNRIGEEVYSVVNGWVMRVRVSPWGYGKAVYIKGLTGEIYVYAHLSDFYSDLRRIVRKEQLRKGSYEVDIWFKEGEVPVKEGEVIAYTGRSGCYDPHLHFELRDENNNPFDPFVRGFTVPDTLPPVIKAVRLVPLDEYSTVSGSHMGRVFNVASDTVSVFVEGIAGLEIETVDMVNTRSGKLDLKEIKLYKNRSLIRREFIDKFSYLNYKDSRFLFDFEYRRRTGRKFRRLFTVQGNGFPFYEGGDGIITGEDRGNYSIEVYDGSGNISRLVIALRDSPGSEKIGSIDLSKNKILFETNGFQIYGKWYDLRKTRDFLKSGDSIAIWNFKKKNFHKLSSPDGRCHIDLTSAGIINTKLIAVKVGNSEIKTWSWEPPVPFKNKAKIKIKVPQKSKFSSIYEKNGSGWSFCSSEREEGYLVDFIDHLGTFGLMEDSVAPEVSLSSKNFSFKMPLRINVLDSLSGIDFYSIKTFIDEKQTVFRYDPQEKRLIFEHPEEISIGKHELKLILSDRQGNKTSRVWEIVRN
ncbi:M23 family metallopeptidase [candidate division WOR-3 bacterium]|nr:M23 family metallopeptidase [candidate division WOR-3 bacterium]